MDWEKEFWNLMYKRGSYVDGLRLRNEQQAGKIMELEFMLSFIRRVGDGVFVLDHDQLMRLCKHYHDHKNRGILSNSKYAKKQSRRGHA